VQAWGVMDVDAVAINNHMERKREATVLEDIKEEVQQLIKEEVQQLIKEEEEQAFKQIVIKEVVADTKEVIKEVEVIKAEEVI